MKEKQLCKSIQWWQWQKYLTCWSKQTFKMYIYLDTSAHYHLRVSVAFCNFKLTDLVHYKRLRARSMLKNICSAANKVWIKQWLLKPCLEAKHLRKTKQRMSRGRHLSARQDVLLYSPTRNEGRGALHPATASIRWRFPTCVLCRVPLYTFTPAIFLDSWWHTSTVLMTVFVLLHMWEEGW